MISGRVAAAFFGLSRSKFKKPERVNREEKKNKAEGSSIPTMYTIHSAAVFLYIYFPPLIACTSMCVCVCIQTRIQASNLFGFTIHSIRPAIWHKCVLLNSRRVAKGGGFESFIPRRLRESR